jgi:hypothetical protein
VLVTIVAGMGAMGLGLAIGLAASVAAGRLMAAAFPTGDSLRNLISCS